ncbi:S-ribosylhomocysteine lyase [Streptomyces sp. NPDC052494]|uniref:S-ribosylhomocysteine lyase n=1 Tax=Streptomyces sp. NPDC052494 TaxID=3365692 RepID=UPI0037CE78E4
MDLDHRKMAPPFLRESYRVPIPNGPDVLVWDLRVGQPNVTRLPDHVVHSVEHALIVYLREHPSVVTAAPMGCATGFYVVALGTLDFAALADLVADALRRLIDATDVPHRNTEQCGAAEHHSLTGAQEVARWLLSRRDDWAQALHPSA